MENCRTPSPLMEDSIKIFFLLNPSLRSISARSCPQKLSLQTVLQSSTSGGNFREDRYSKGDIIFSPFTTFEKYYNIIYQSRLTKHSLVTQNLYQTMNKYGDWCLLYAHYLSILLIIYHQTTSSKVNVTIYWSLIVFEMIELWSAPLNWLSDREETDRHS